MSKLRTELREEMKLVTSNLDERWLKAASSEVCKQLNNLLETQLKQPVEHILAFQPLQHGSVDLSAFVKHQLQLSRNVYIPCGGKNNFTIHKIQSAKQSDTPLSQLKLFACEDISQAAFAIEGGSTTIILMPGLAYDLQGNRIGWGKLHYERILRKRELRSAIRVGVCWELQVQAAVPAGQTDLLVDWIVHEQAAISTGVEVQSDQEINFD